MNEGWARRRNVKSIVYHYIRAGQSVCAKGWQDIQGPLSGALPPGCKPCPNCVAELARPAGDRRV